MTVGTIVVDKIHSVWIIIMLDTAGGWEVEAGRET